MVSHDLRCDATELVAGDIVIMWCEAGDWRQYVSLDRDDDETAVVQLERLLQAAHAHKAEVARDEIHGAIRPDGPRAARDS